MMKKPAMWTSLHDYDGDTVAIVVPDGTEPLDGIIAILADHYGGTFSRDNPVLVEEAKTIKIETWHSCTKPWREGEGVYDEGQPDWWAPDGDGRRMIQVIALERSLWVLGEMAEEAEEDKTDDGA